MAYEQGTGSGQEIQPRSTNSCVNRRIINSETTTRHAQSARAKKFYLEKKISHKFWVYLLCGERADASETS